MIKKPIIGIIGGKGVLGGHFATFFNDRDIKVLISDKKTQLSNIELVKKADIIIVSVPIHLTKKVIHDILLQTME